MTVLSIIVYTAYQLNLKWLHSVGSRTWEGGGTRCGRGPRPQGVWGSRCKLPYPELQKLCNFGVSALKI